MHRLTKPLVVATLAIGLVGGMASVGSASVSTDKKSYCQGFNELGQDVTQPDPDSTDIPRETAADLEEKFRDLAKEAPNKKLKKATNTIADWYGEVADSDDATDIDQDLSERYGKAIAKVATYAVSKCIAESIPDITLPGGGKVDIPGLGD